MAGNEEGGLITGHVGRDQLHGVVMVNEQGQE